MKCLAEMKRLVGIDLNQNEFKKEKQVAAPSRTMDADWRGCLSILCQSSAIQLLNTAE